jgi:hypothetical protein
VEKLQGGRGAGSGGGCKRAASKKTSRKKYRGVSLEKKTGRWRAECTIGGKQKFLGTFGSEEDAARACDRARLWSCKADGKTKKEVELNFSHSEYNDDDNDEVTALQGLTQEEMIQKLRRTGQEERVANQSSKFTGVTLDKRTSRWRAKCKVGGKKTSLGNFDSEKEAARAWDRFKLWRCKADGKTKEDVEVELNFSFSDYSDDEVTALQELTQEEMIQKLRQAGKAVERPASPPGPGAAVGVKREAADVVPAVGDEAPAGQPPLKKIKVEEVETVEETCVGGGAVVEPAEEDAGMDFNNNGSHEDEAAEDVDAMAVVTPDRPRSSRVNKLPVPIKREDLENGLVRCPRCKGGVLASERGCNIVTCRVMHEETLAGTFGGGWCYFCFHCGVENNGDHCPSPLCPQRVDPEARAAAAAMRNEAAANNPVDLRGD